MGVNGSCLQATVKWAYCTVLKAENFFLCSHVFICSSVDLGACDASN